MDPDNYQQAWQAHSSQTRVTIDANLLLKEVQRSQRNFRAEIIWGDFAEFGFVLLLLALWFYMGAAHALPWTWYLTVPVLVWYVGFRLIYRRRHKQKPSEPGEPLLQCVKESLSDQENQIWLMRNVFWWDLLPLSISILAFFAHVEWLKQHEDWSDALDALGTVAVVFVVFYFVYLSTQYGVRPKLEPRRAALLTLLTSLSDEMASADTHDNLTASVVSLSEKTCMTPRRFAASFAIGVMALMGFGSIMFAMINMDPNFITGDGYPVRSPFAAVRWQESQPEVKLGEEWFKLVSLDEIPASEIVSFSRRTYGNRWHKRFEEDLVELLTGMKHPPQDTVTLVVQSLTSSETSVREDVPMTYTNRRAIWNAAHERTTAEPRRERVAHTAVCIDNTEQFRKRIDEFLHLAQVNAGFSGVVVVARGGAPDYQGTFGFSHLASGIPNSLDTPFRIAALSQSFTSAAIFALEADGNFSVDDPVHRYLPEFEAEAYRGITIYHLLTHTSGLPRIPEDATGRARWVAMSRAATPVNDYVRLACECPLKFQPGQRRLYSNVGYRILSALIVRITGEEYADFMQGRLFEPLGLRQSGVARILQPPDEAIVAESVSRVSLDSRTSEPSFVSTDSGQNYGSGYGSGWIYASANDLVRWDRVLAGDRFLSAGQKARLFQPAREYYACGWIVKKSGLDGRVYQTYTGGNYGYFSRIMRIPEADLVIIALGNVRKTDDIDEVLDQLFRLCRSLPYQEF